jgi:hypothetical protein
VCVLVGQWPSHTCIHCVFYQGNLTRTHACVCFVRAACPHTHSCVCFVRAMYALTHIHVCVLLGPCALAHFHVCVCFVRAVPSHTFMCVCVLVGLCAPTNIHVAVRPRNLLHVVDPAAPAHSCCTYVPCTVRTVRPSSHCRCVCSFCVKWGSVPAHALYCCVQY